MRRRIGADRRANVDAVKELLQTTAAATALALVVAVPLAVAAFAVPGGWAAWRVGLAAGALAWMVAFIWFVIAEAASRESEQSRGPR